jgi:hypothetical protein
VCLLLLLNLCFPMYGIQLQNPFGRFKYCEFY